MAGIMRHISELFVDYPDLIQDFGSFTPPGYDFEYDSENKLGTVRIITPQGSTVLDNTPGRDGGKSPNRGKR